MGFKVFKTREEAEALVAERRKVSPKGSVNYGVVDGYLVKRKNDFPGSPDEYLMEDDSFKKEGGEGDKLVYPGFDPRVHVDPPEK